jgi:hypothetical protein
MQHRTPKERTWRKETKENWRHAKVEEGENNKTAGAQSFKVLVRPRIWIPAVTAEPSMLDRRLFLDYSTLFDDCKPAASLASSGCPPAGLHKYS